MNVLHINFSDRHQGGGGAIAMYRLHQGLRDLGVESHILCHLKTLPGSESTLHPAPTRRDRLAQCFTQRLGLNDIHNLSTFKIQDLPVYQQADVLNLHIIHSNYFNYLALPKLTRNKPAVFTLHDMWALTGHCAYSYGCERWKIGCGRCPDLKIQPSVRRDATAWEWKLKQNVYTRSKIAIVADSSWLAQLAQDSMLKDLPISHIPYGLDIEIYQPLNKQECRKALGVSSRYVLMFSAANLSDKRKGGDLLVKALKILPESLKSEILLLILGERGDEFSQSVDIPSLNLGYVNSDQLKAILYSASDLFLLPSRAEAFGIVAQEAASCGTPTIAFNVGGIPDIVRPGLTGYLAHPEDYIEMSQLIIRLLGNNDLRRKMSEVCRAIACQEYSLALHANRYIELYNEVLN